MLFFDFAFCFFCVLCTKYAAQKNKHTSKQRARERVIIYVEQEMLPQAIMMRTTSHRQAMLTTFICKNGPPAKGGFGFDHRGHLTPTPPWPTTTTVSRAAHRLLPLWFVSVSAIASCRSGLSRCLGVSCASFNWAHHPRCQTSGGSENIRMRARLPRRGGHAMRLRTNSPVPRSATRCAHPAMRSRT